MALSACGQTPAGAGPAASNCLTAQLTCLLWEGIGLVLVSGYEIVDSCGVIPDILYFPLKGNADFASVENHFFGL